MKRQKAYRKKRMSKNSTTKSHEYQKKWAKDDTEMRRMPYRNVSRTLLIANGKHGDSNVRNQMVYCFTEEHALMNKGLDKLAIYVFVFISNINSAKLSFDTVTGLQSAINIAWTTTLWSVAGYIFKQTFLLARWTCFRWWWSSKGISAIFTFPECFSALRTDIIFKWCLRLITTVGTFFQIHSKYSFNKVGCWTLSILAWPKNKSTLLRELAKH